LGTRKFEKVTEFEHEIHIPHNAIHKVLLSHALAKVIPINGCIGCIGSDTSMITGPSLMYLDWRISDHNGKWCWSLLCSMIARFVLADGEFDA
jgi:hypothetical protein